MLYCCYSTGAYSSSHSSFRLAAVPAHASSLITTVSAGTAVAVAVGVSVLVGVRVAVCVAVAVGVKVGVAAEAGNDQWTHLAGADAEPLPDLEFDQTLGL